MTRRDTLWRDQDIAQRFLGVRTAFPYALDHPKIVCDILRTGRPIARFMDVGCGGGFFTEAVHRDWPEATAVMIDFSDPMLREAAALVAGPHEVHARDLADPDWSRDLGSVDAVVSGFAIHHLPDETKRSVYADIHDLLRPGGWFVHVEHVASASGVGAQLFDKQVTDALHRYFARDEPGVTREQVAERWDDRGDDQANILAPVWDQCAWLREIGFEDIDCFFKSYEVAIFGGRRAADDSVRGVYNDYGVDGHARED